MLVGRIKIREMKLEEARTGPRGFSPKFSSYPSDANEVGLKQQDAPLCIGLTQISKA